MKILFLAPQPFFQERGTPIAVKLALEVLADRFKNKAEDTQKIDLLTYHEGIDVKIPGVTINRIRYCSLIKGIGPGISYKKLLCDIVFLFTAISMALKNGKEQYDLVHAVEESVFVALVLKFLFGIPYIYDMDSSIALQVAEKWWWLKPIAPILSLFEKVAVKFSSAVVPVCDSLALIADKHGSKDTHILRDISLMKLDTGKIPKKDLREEIEATKDDIVILYVGNLEEYQGVKLLIKSFAKISSKFKQARLAIVGGTESFFSEYDLFIKSLPYSDRIHMLGPRPVSKLGDYLMEADILASPRTKGNNTPMKIYSYLHSGKAIIATALPTHTQVMDDKVSLLVKPKVEDFSQGLEQLITNSELRQKLGNAARHLAEENYTYKVFHRRLNELYNRLNTRINEGLARSSSLVAIYWYNLSLMI